MSGGSHDYICYQIKHSLCGEMEDEDLNELVKDLVDLTHDLEWYHSADISEEDYRKTATAFKEKWLKDRPPTKEAEWSFVIACGTPGSGGRGGK